MGRLRPTLLLALLLACCLAMAAPCQEVRQAPRIAAARAEVLVAVAGRLRGLAEGVRKRVRSRVEEMQLSQKDRDEIARGLAAELARKHVQVATGLLSRLFDELNALTRGDLGPQESDVLDAALKVGNELYSCWGLRRAREQASKRFEIAIAMYRLAAKRQNPALIVKWGTQSLESTQFRWQHEKGDGSWLNDATIKRLGDVRRSCAGHVKEESEEARLRSATNDLLAGDLGQHVHKAVVRAAEADQLLEQWFGGRARADSWQDIVNGVLQSLCQRFKKDRNVSHLVSLYAVLRVARDLGGDTWEKTLQAEGGFKKLDVIRVSVSETKTEEKLKPDAYKVAVWVDGRFQELSGGNHPFYLPYETVVFRVSLKDAARETGYLATFLGTKPSLELRVPDVSEKGWQFVSGGSKPGYVRPRPMNTGTFRRIFERQLAEEREAAFKLSGRAATGRLELTDAEARKLVRFLLDDEEVRKLPDGDYALVLECLIAQARLGQAQALTQETFGSDGNKPATAKTYVLFEHRSVDL